MRLPLGRFVRLNRVAPSWWRYHDDGSLSRGVSALAESVTLALAVSIFHRRSQPGSRSHLARQLMPYRNVSLPPTMKLGAQARNPHKHRRSLVLVQYFHDASFSSSFSSIDSPRKRSGTLSNLHIDPPRSLPSCDTLSGVLQRPSCRYYRVPDSETASRAQRREYLVRKSTSEAHDTSYTWHRRQPC